MPGGAARAAAARCVRSAKLPNPRLLHSRARALRNEPSSPLRSYPANFRKGKFASQIGSLHAVLCAAAVPIKVSEVVERLPAGIFATTKSVGMLLEVMRSRKHVASEPTHGTADALLWSIGS